nr:hypothetical protein GCM10020092_020600 [Actinoplanes digitatis]
MSPWQAASHTRSCSTSDTVAIGVSKMALGDERDPVVRVLDGLVDKPVPAHRVEAALLLGSDAVQIFEGIARFRAAVGHGETTSRK